MWKLAVDPANPDIVIFTTRYDGTYKTTNGTAGAGTIWTLDATVPDNSNSGGFAFDNSGQGCVLFDPSSSVIGGATQRIAVSVSGSGIWISNNAGSSWTLLTNPQSSTQNIVWLAYTPSGNVLYAIDGTNVSNGILWKITGTSNPGTATWTNISAASALTSNVVGAAIDPSNSSHLFIISFEGPAQESANAGSSWAAAVSSFTRTATDIPYLTSGSFGSSGPNGVIAPLFDPLDNTKIWVSASQDVYTFTVPLGTPVAMTSVGSGIEEFFGTAIIPTRSGQTVLGCADVAALISGDFTKYVTTQTAYNSATLSKIFGPDISTTTLLNTENFIVAIIQDDVGNDFSPQQTGYSTNNGSSWTPFASVPSGSHFGGNIACASSSNMVWSTADGGDGYYTTDGGATWHSTGLPNPGIGGFATYSHGAPVCADRTTVGTFYAVLLHWSDRNRHLRLD